MHVSPKRGILTFADLPKELRDHIWRYAIPSCYAKPQAQFFGLRKDVDYIIAICWEGSPYRERLSPMTSLCPPHRNNGQMVHMDDWAHQDNHSAYLVTSSLWNACRESRQVMEMCFNDHYEKQDPREDVRAVTAVLVDDPHGQCITTRPGIDLMHISTGSLAMITDSNLPFVEYFYYGGPRIRPRNFGVDYNQSWAKKIAVLLREKERWSWEDNRWDRWDAFPDEQTDLHGAIALAAGAWQGKILWLIDHHLHQTRLEEESVEQTESESSPNRDMFYADGRRYVEVAREDIGVCWERLEDQGDNVTSHDFADQLIDFAGPCDWDFTESSSDCGARSWGCELDVKVLGCIRD